MEQYFLNGFGITTKSWYLTYDQLTREYHLCNHNGVVWYAWDTYTGMYLTVLQWANIGDTEAQEAIEAIGKLVYNYP